jgi:hypothetical protein
MKRASSLLRDGRRIVVRDMVPRLAALLRAARTPLGCLVMAGAASALCGFFLHAQGFVVLFAVIAVTILGLACPWLSVHVVAGSLAFSRARGREAEPVPALVSLRNRAPWHIWGLSVRCGEGEGTEGLGAPADRVSVALVPGRRSVSATITFTPRCRGVYPRTPC